MQNANTSFFLKNWMPFLKRILKLFFELKIRAHNETRVVVNQQNIQIFQQPNQKSILLFEQLSKIFKQQHNDNVYNLTPNGV